MTGTLNVLADAGQQSTTVETLITTVGALLGVVVGRFLTVILDSARQGRREERLERAARRLLSNELAEASEVFRHVAGERVVRREHLPEPIAPWDQYRELLASRMDDLQWHQVATAVLTVHRLRGELEPLATTEVGLGQLRPALVTELQEAAQTLDDTVALLGSPSGLTPPEVAATQH